MTSLTISGTKAGQKTGDTTSISPFATVGIADTNESDIDTVTVAMSSMTNGTLTNLGGGSYNAATGVYTDTGSAAAVTGALNGLVFTPTPHEVAPGQTVATGFAVTVVDTAGARTTDTATVITTAIAVPPTISGTVAGLTTADTSMLFPFSKVIVTDVNLAQTETVNATLSAAANGTLTNLGGGTYNATTGIYADTGSAAAVTAALDGLVFTPTAHEVAPGQTVATGFTLAVVDTAGAHASATTSVVTTTPPSVIIGGSASPSGGSTTQGNVPGAIGQDYAQLISSMSAFKASGSKVFYIQAGDLAQASPAQIGRIINGVTITSSVVQQNQNLLDAIGAYCRTNGISVQVAAQLDNPPSGDWTYQWLLPAVQAGLPISAVENVDEDAVTAANSPSNWATLAGDELAIVRQIASYYPTVQIGQWEGGSSISAMVNQWTAYDNAASAAGLPNISYVVADTSWNAPWVTSPSSYQGWLENLSQTVSLSDMKLDVLLDGVNTDTDDLQWTAQSEQHAEILASLPGVSVNALLVTSWDSAYPDASLPINEPTTTGNDATEIAATYPLYQADEITAQGAVLIAARPQVIASVGVAASLGPTSLTWGASDLATHARIAVVVMDQEGILSAQQSGAGTVTGSGSNVLILDGDSTDIASEMASVKVTEPNSGPDVVDTEIFGANGRVADAQTTVLALPSLSVASGTTYSFAPASSTQEWVAATASINASNTITTETLTWNSTATNLSTGAYQAMKVDSIHEPIAEPGVTLVNGIVEEPLANPSAGTAGSLPFSLSSWNPNAFDASTQVIPINVLKTVMTYGAQSGSLESVVDTLAPTSVTNSALPTQLLSYLTSGGLQVTQMNTGDNSNWLSDWNKALASVTTTYGSSGQVLEQLFQGGATEPYFTLDNVFDPANGRLWEQIQSGAPPASSSTFVTGDEYVTEFNTGDNPNWDYADWGSASQVTLTFQDYYVTSVSLTAPNPAGMLTTSAYSSIGGTSPNGQLAISGTMAGQPTSDTTALSPFSKVTVTDANLAQTETVSVTLSAAANGTLTNLGGGSYNTATGIYTDTGSAAAVTAALDGLVFTPTVHEVAPGQTVTTGFTLAVVDTAGTDATDATTTVITTAIAVPPTISGTAAGQKTSDITALSPFSKIAVTDANLAQTEMVSVALSAAANGALTNLGGGTYNAATGVYTDTGSTAAITGALNGLVFTPTPHEVAPGQTVATGFTLTVIDTAGARTTNTTTTVITTAVAVPPTVSGTVAGQTTADTSTLSPFSKVTVTDANLAQTETVSVTLSSAANGTLTNLGGGSYNATTGIYTDTGSAAAVTAALDGLVFTPTTKGVALTQTVTTSFTIDDTDSASANATDQITTVIVTAPQNIVDAPDGTCFVYVYNPTSTATETASEYSATDPITGAPTGVKISEVVDNSNGTALVYSYNPTGTVALTAQESSGINTANGAPAGNKISDVVDNANGTSLLYSYDPTSTVTQTASEYSSTDPTNGAPSGREISDVVDNTDGTSILYAYNPSSTVLETACFYSGTNATTGAPTGRLTSETFDYTNGESSITAYNSNGTSSTTYYSGPNGTGSTISGLASTAATGGQVASAAAGVLSTTASTSQAVTDSANGVITITGSGQFVDPGTGNHTIQFISGATADTLVLHSGGSDQILGFDSAAGDILNLSSLLSQVQVNITDIAQLEKYVSVTNLNGSADILFDPTGHGDGNQVALLVNDGTQVTQLQTLLMSHNYL